MTVTGVKVATEALGEVDAFSAYDTAPDASDLCITLDRLRMLLAEMVGTEKMWFFVPTTETVTLAEIGDEFYYLNALTDTDLQFVHNINVITDGDETGVDVIDRDEWEEKRASGSYDTPGIPLFAYIERSANNPKIYFLPVTEVATTAKINGQKYSPDVTQDAGAIDTEFPAAWERYLILLTAYDIGRGRITTLPPGRRKDLKADLDEVQDALMARNNKEQSREAHVENRDF